MAYFRVQADKPAPINVQAHVDTPKNEEKENTQPASELVNKEKDDSSAAA